ncbi:MAG: hypothetical protein RJB55_1818 [Verrucomicrobiota bacterium]
MITRLLPTALLLAALFVLAGCGTGPAGGGAPRDAFVLLSGGGTPLSNNYSQYLQAKAFATYFERRHADRPHWVFFGVGNREGEAPVLADVRRQVRRDGRLVESWLPGPLKNNRPATRASFLGALRDEILPVVRGGGTLYLFIGDHGTESRGDNPESLITMWQLRRGEGRDSWSTDNAETLGVAELRRVLADGIGRGRVVFVMTQCHSGGFHELGVPREVAPPAEWFSRRPAWLRAAAAQPALAAAGFTATDQASPAAGCDPAPDPDSWAGYERYVPEALLGYDLFTLAETGPGRRSLAEAHEAATLVDATIDKPRATSEYYLETWARAIERIAEDPELTPRAAAAVTAYRWAVDTGRITAKSPALREREEQYARFTRRITEQAPSAGPRLLAATRAALEGDVPASERRGGGGRSRGAPDEMRRAWNEVVRPAWKKAVLAGEIDGLTGAALTFEKRLLDLEDQGRNFMTTRGGDPLLNEMYWRSGYAHPARLDVAKAEAVTYWGATRRDKVGAWAHASGEAAVREAAVRMRLPGGPRAPSRATPASESRAPADDLDQRTAAARILFYRRVLAAWEFLETMNHASALERLRELTALERTPLP